MVATKLLEVTNKGTEWARGSSTSTPSRPERTASSATGTPACSHHPNALLAPPPPPPPPSHPLYTTHTQQYSHHQETSPSTSSYWSYAKDSLRSAADTTYSTFTGILSSLVYSDRNSNNDHIYSSSSYLSSIRRSFTAASLTPTNNNPATAVAPGGAFASPPPAEPTDPLLIRRLESAGSHTSANSSRHEQHSQYSASASTTSRGGRFHAKDIAWIWKNPYSSVRGRQHNERPSSVAAVRSLLALVPVEESTSVNNTINHDAEFPPLLEPLLEKQPSGENNDQDDDDDEAKEEDSQDAASSPTFHHKNATTRTKITEPTKLQHQPDSPSMDESWPDQEHHHHAAGRGKSIQQPHTTTRTTNSVGRASTSVSPPETASQLAEGTIRALRDLALEEAVELQEALRYWNSRWEQPLWSWLEAGPWVWFSSTGYNHQTVGHLVAQIQAVLARRCSAIGELQQHLLRAGWQQGVAQWGVLGHGGGEWAAVAGFDRANNSRTSMMNDSLVMGKAQHPFPKPSSWGSPMPARGSSSGGVADTRRLSCEIGDVRPDSAVQKGMHRLPPNKRGRHQHHSRSSKVFVHMNDGGGLFVEDRGFLVEWSVEAMALIRKHLYRAGNGLVILPFESNWLTNVDTEHEEEDGGGTLISIPDAGPFQSNLPAWAAEVVKTERETADPDSPMQEEPRKELTISNLPLLAAEVEELLDVMEEIMAMQRRRRLDQLRAPNWFRRNWYVVATSMPTLGSFLFWMARRGRGKLLVKSLVHSVSSFLKERLRDPVVSICNELWKGRESFSDKKARMEAMETLKKMIRSWLDDYYPNMPDDYRHLMADAMDVSLIEAKKEESMKTFYEINNVVRMSFIEMQYMKKEMMNALHAMDEMMSANDINMNIAAITPAVILAYMGSRIFRFFFYALLKLGKSKEETYGSFRNIVTDIERLLVMRDNPPQPPPSSGELDYEVASIPKRPCQLGPDDLGMVLLLVHECRRILWQDRRRFSRETIKSVSEDLAELAGERGAVSVQQQLQIIARMCRTYPFLKVISTGKMFEFHRPALA